jgi:CHAT domain-containing protein
MIRSLPIGRIIALALLAASLVFGAEVQPLTREDRAEIQALVENSYRSYDSKKVEDVAALWSEHSPDLKSRKSVLQLFFKSDPAVIVRSRQIGTPTLEGEIVRVPVTLSITGPNSHSRNYEALVTRLRVVELKKEEGKWKVWRETSPELLMAEQIIHAPEGDRDALLKENRSLMNHELVFGLVDAMEPARAAGRYAEILPIYQLALKIAESLRDEGGKAQAINAIAAVAFGQSRFDEALAGYQRALTIYQKLGWKTRLSGVLGNIALVDRFIGDYDLALDYTRRSLKLAEELHDDRIVAFSSINEGVIDRTTIGNFRAALAAFQRAAAVATNLGDQDLRATALNGIGSVYLQQGQFALAEDHFRQALTLWQNAGNTPGIASALNNLGTVLLAWEKWDDALETFGRALELKQKLGDRQGVTIALRNAGQALRGAGKLDDALADFNKALQISGEVNDQRGVMEASYQIALAHLLKKNYAAALEWAGKASAAAEKEGAMEFGWMARATAGDAHRALGHRDEAYRAFRDAIATIETLRTQVAGAEESRQLYFQSATWPYESMVDLLVSEGKSEEAFSVAESAKARVVTEVLRDGKVDFTRFLSPEKKAEERTLRTTIAAASAQVRDERRKKPPDEEAVRELEKKLDATRLAHDNFVATVYANSPELRFRQGDIGAFQVPELRRLVDDGHTALVEYVVTEERAFVFVASLGGSDRQLSIVSHVIELPSAELKKKADAFESQIAERDLGFRTAARELYNLLLTPVAPEIAGADTLIIIPDGPLWSIPFQALEAPGGKFLIEEKTALLAPSADALVEMKKRRESIEHGVAPRLILLAMGNPALGPQAAALPNSEREVMQLGQLYGSARSHVYVGAAATETRLDEEAPQARILHLATHGVFDDRSPMHSYLLLSAAKETADDDGLIEAAELMNTRLPEELTVLSACQTARGRYGAGEGVIGLTWAIFVAGCPVTVVSQWSVDSASTTQLMIAFHRRVSEGFRAGSPTHTAASLRAAALELLHGETYRHPFYWAGFSVIGAGQ